MRLNIFGTHELDKLQGRMLTVYEIKETEKIVLNAGTPDNSSDEGRAFGRAMLAVNGKTVDVFFGWMSSNYVDLSPDYHFAPIPLGRTPEGCPLYACAKDKKPTAELAPGTTFHILAEYDGMYHICIPQGELTWAVDPDGTYGYIPKKNVLTGYSPSALDAQANAQ